MSFDWTAWADSERRAAQLRTGSNDPKTLAADKRFGRVVDVIQAWERAQALLGWAYSSWLRLCAEAGEDPQEARQGRQADDAGPEVRSVLDPVVARAYEMGYDDGFAQRLAEEGNR